MADDEDSAVLSDVDDDEDPSPSPIPSTSDTNDPLHQRIHDLLTELDRERRARQESEDALKRRDESINRLRAFAQDVIKKRDDAVRDKEDALSKLADSVKSNDEISKQLDESIREKDEILKQKDNLKSEVEIGSQMMVRGIDKISGKISDFKNFAAAGGLPRSQKYATGLPAVAYGVIKRANEIVEELMKQIEGATKSRDQAREQVEQRNYEIAIEVSQLEAAISGLKEEVREKRAEIERLDGLVRERDERNSEMERLVKEMRGIGEERERKLKGLEEKVNSWRPLVVDELSNVSKAYELIHEVVRVAGGEGVDPTWDSSFVWEEMGLDESLRMLLDGTAAVCATAKVAVERVSSEMEEKGREIDGLKEKVDGLVGEKQHIGTLLRSALQCKTNEVLQVAEDGLREAGIDLRFDERSKSGVEAGEVDEVYTLAGALENTVKASQLEIIELKHLVEALRAESSLLKAHLDAQAKSIAKQNHQIKELEEKERVANENVEGLMLDIAAAEEEIARWKAAAEQEAAAGRAVEQEFLSQLSTVRQELDETKQALLELENKLKFKEETAAAAMAARDAAVNSLRLADLRSTRLRERVEELTHQIEESDGRIGPRNSQNSHRYVCWPWQWLGLNLVRPQQTDVLENTNEMELSEPLI